ncbi:dnaG: DNA primase [Rubrobacter radiotolerans]|uniref:DNA primase n=1 Tax=Rubrobacter radiotolerans TaxID=42256 RepID=A0A023X2V1_RUBRA|nr:DNA primase [Rubrobacter radiotolerans]AHY46792.1 dnaG: DNA primase [Rubrobacter radiotolerans]MDX5894199.1 DNA primase [Rubrobacter radiotolerans]SMC05457.1 DNA primase [Rubrobacter radiotolerans DSM 5868]
MRISQASIEAVREAADIVEVASEFTALRRQGNRFVGLCPYPDHQEKSPSFSVSPEQGFYYCFGCQRGGDAIKLVTDLNSLSFHEAVSHLADRSNIELQFEGSSRDAEETRRRQTRRKRIHKALAAAAAYYHKVLIASDSPLAKEARDYLEHRGFTRSTIEEFRLGYAFPRGRGGLLQVLSRFGLERRDLDGAGLLAGSGERFAGRVMFPISDRQGRIVGFGGRALGDDGPKYLNSPETEVFDKRSLLYGFPQVMEGIRTERAAILVEGYTDVLALYQAGIRNAVATLGTAATPAHLKVLARVFGKNTDRVYALFDPDAAGNRAASRLVDPENSLAGVAAELQLDLQMVPLTEDPADWLRERSAEEFREELGKSIPVVEYVLRTVVSEQRGQSAASRSRAVPQVRSLIQSMGDPVVRRDAIRLASEYLGLPAEELIPPPSRTQSVAPAQSPRGGSPRRDDPHVQAGLDVLALIVADPRRTAELVHGGLEVPGREGEADLLVLMPDDFATEGQGKLFALLAGHISEDSDSLDSLLSDDEVRPFMDHLGRLSARGEHLHADAPFLREAWLRLAILSRQREMRTSGDFDLREALFEEIQRLKSALSANAAGGPPARSDRS